MFTVIFQLTGAVLLAAGLAFGKRKEIIESSIGQGVLFKSKDSKVPIIIKEKWNETFLCRWGLIYTIIGYFIGMFEEELFPNFQFQTITKVLIVLVSVIILSMLTSKICKISADRKYQTTSIEEVEQNVRPNTIIFKLTEEIKDNIQN